MSENKSKKVIILGYDDRAERFINEFSHNGSHRSIYIFDKNMDNSLEKKVRSMGAMIINDLDPSIFEDEDALFIVNDKKLLGGNIFRYFDKMKSRGFERAGKVLNETKKELEKQAAGLKKDNKNISTMNKRLEDKNKQLEELDDLKTDFISIVSHELRTPLAVVKEGIDIMFDGVVGEINDQQKKVLASSKRNVDRLARIIESLLDISKIKSGRSSFKRDKINFLEVVRKAVEMYSAIASGRGLSLDVRTPDEEVLIYADREKMNRVMINLMDNAMKFMENGTLGVHVSLEEDFVLCSISDTGKGIKESDFQGIFSEFIQVDRVDGGGAKGTGLGLSIVEEIIEMHGGMIEVASDIGKGSVFTFKIPRFTEEGFIENVIENSIEESIINGSSLGLLTVYFSNVDGETCVNDDEIIRITRDMRTIFQNVLRGPSDKVFFIRGKLVVVLQDSAENDIFPVIARLKKTFREYAVSHDGLDKIEIRTGYSIYPGESKSFKEILEKDIA